MKKGWRRAGILQCLLVERFVGLELRHQTELRYLFPRAFIVLVIGIRTLSSSEIVTLSFFLFFYFLIERLSYSSSIVVNAAAF